MAFSRVRVGPDRLVVLDYNPKGTKHWAEAEYWDRADDLGMEQIQFSLGDNPGLQSDWVAEQHAKYPAGTAKHRRYVLGQPADDEGRVYKFVTHSQPPKGDPRYLFAGVDAGNSMDHPTHALLLGEWDNKGVWVLDEWRYPTDLADTLLTPEQHAEGMIERFAAWGEVVRWAVDPAALYMLNALKRRGQRAVKAVNDRKEGIEVLDAYLTRGVFQIARDRTPHLDREIANYVWNTKHDGRERERMPVEVDDHSVDALRYGAMWRNRMRAALNLRQNVGSRMGQLAGRWVDGT
ncbi:MAG: hypothetical protein OXC29_00510 [Rhodococcus sp.]|nr:hypothetical protein [Rhodococcus sp. (in: high G+C Gram-positive bacteria)]